eukprot:gene13258-3875_t
MEAATDLYWIHSIMVIPVSTGYPAHSKSVACRISTTMAFQTVLHNLKMVLTSIPQVKTLGEYTGP